MAERASGTHLLEPALGGQHRSLARAYLLAGNCRQTKWHCKEAVTIAERIPYHLDAGVVHHILAEVAVATGGDPEPHHKEGIERISSYKRSYELSQILMSYGKWQMEAVEKTEGEELQEGTIGFR